MRELSMNEVEQVSGGSWELGLAETWVGAVAGVALGTVGAPVLAAGAVGLALGGAFVLTDALINPS